MSRSGLALTYQVDVRAGFIDRDYRGNVTVLLEKSSMEPHNIRCGDKIAQLILYEISSPPIEQVSTLDTTIRGANGFGSSDISSPQHATVQHGEISRPPETILDPVQNASPQTLSKITDKIHTLDGIKPYNIWMSQNPFDNELNIQIDIRGDHPTLGMHLKLCRDRSRLQFHDMTVSTPGARIPKWRSTLKCAYLKSINGKDVWTQEDSVQAILQGQER
jgi:hypothetical protein